MAIRLKQAGCDDVRVFEKGGDVGGVWRENSYPGAACDVPSHLYSFLFEPNPRWSRRFAEQEQIHDYLRHCADKYDVRRQIRLRTEVLSAAYDEGAAQWELQLSDGSTHRADVLIPACGQLSAPSVPEIAGLDDFAGELFHSAHWPDDIALEGKHVAVIGTGASAIQIVPSIAERVGRLRLFQREAAHVIRKPDYAYPEAAKRVFERIPALLKASRWLTYLQLESRALPFNAS
ncbi:flavin-containing monooxygenase [Flexivirga aerilata]|uniref:flavin-containing monooxygenase n=1 Tax=Flexivirga aerilata TaxID=1656889 RepID=UPI001BB2034A|nr:NAD(P)/FAD-dependent oxidoreductase [Flexivirga aerilata]